MNGTFDCIVIGVGGFGSGALYHLARRGVRALGIEQFGVAHDRGSSHGETRIIRKAYFEHPDYVPLLERAFELWSELEAETGTRLYEQCGLLIGGPAAHGAVPGALLAARLHNLNVSHLSAADAAARFPGFRIPAEYEVVFETEAGSLMVEECVRTHIRQAEARGAVLRTGETVRAWRSDGKRVEVETDQGTYAAASLIVTAGAWAARVLEDLGTPLTVLRKVVFWHETTIPDYDASRGAPTFFFDTSEGEFYGFPSFDGRTVKVAEHTGGNVVENPREVDRTLHGDDHVRVEAFLRRVLPGLRPEPQRHSVCLYTKSRDSHFIVDHHPRYRNVVLGAGFSGHGFKFTSVIGEVLAELAVTHETAKPIGFLSLGREALRGESGSRG